MNPVVTASQSSWRCVQSHDREGWLALMADDIVVEDPIGEAVTNPDGTGVKGKEALAAFYDRVRAEPTTRRFFREESHIAAASKAQPAANTTSGPIALCNPASAANQRGAVSAARPNCLAKC